ncbi:hypothetical protein [Micromonospora sp. KC721]|uniref:hypothetical protein n=1 Tax=Micromonospora sp. KC721 TaxID=2530380 RepID=UPI001A9CDBEF|nr:hypothetical protein [Micromonospora sp. KC721]
MVDVPAKLARRVRMLSTGHGRADDVWHVDVSDHRNAIAAYRDALGYVKLSP